MAGDSIESTGTHSIELIDLRMVMGNITLKAYSMPDPFHQKWTRLSLFRLRNKLWPFEELKKVYLCQLKAFYG